MSIGTRLPLRHAVAEAETFKALFDGTYERWTIAGSIRRQKPEVSDVDHVIIPTWGDVPAEGLFAEMKRVNLLMRRADQLVADGTITKHFYGITGPRWGPLSRGCDFHGLLHELRTATVENWGSQLAIRTGPAELSRTLVTGLRKYGYRNQDGDVWRCIRCPEYKLDARCPESCVHCQGTGLKCVDRVSVHTEETYFELAGERYVPPEKRP